VTGWLRRLLHGRQLERHLDAELRDHLERQVQAYVLDGMTEVYARRQARIVFGGVEQVKELCRDERRTLGVEHFRRDVAYTLRQLRRRPGFWAIVMVTLVVGIATTTSMFAVVNGVLLRPLPYAAADRVVSIANAGYRGVYLEVQARSRTMDVGAYTSPAPVTLTGRGEPVRLAAVMVDAHLFDVLGVPAFIGRRFASDDVTPGARPAAVLSYGLWRGRFGGDTAIVGQSITIDGIAHTVVGVMPRDFTFPDGREIALPLIINPASQIDLWANSATMIARLRSGSTLEQAQQELRVIVPALRQRFPWSMPADFGLNVAALPLLDQTVGGVRPTLLVLFAAVIAVLLVVCVNVANLLLTRGLGRERELAIRAAVGATRSRLVVQLVLESVTVSMVAGLLGIAASFGMLRLIVAVLPADVPRLQNIGIDAHVLAFAIATSAVVGLIFGIVPAVRATCPGVRLVLTVGGVAPLQVSERRTARRLATIEFALAVMLVVAAALLVESLRHLLAVDPGFRAEQLIIASVAPPLERYGRPEAQMRYVDELLTRLRAVPGVQSVAAGYAAPFAGPQYGGVFWIEGRPDPTTRTGDWAMADVRAVVTPDYLRVLGVPMVEGRPLSSDDRSAAPRVAVISRSLALAYWGTRSPLGARIRLPGATAPWITIVGVAADIKWNSLGAEERWAGGASTGGFLKTMYLPLAQVPLIDRNGIRLLVRSGAGPRPRAADLRAIVGSVDADAAVSEITSGAAAIASSVARPRFTAVLLALFAGVALFLGALGVYGVLAYGVRRRSHEFAVRLALGASGRDLRRSVLREGVRLTLAGVGLGVVGALLATRALTRLLFGVTPMEASIFVTVAVVLVGVGVLASYLPARRAMRVNPLAALRSE
jgi:predicted permease